MANVRNPFERQHIANLAAYVRMIDEIFRQATQEAASIGAMVQNIGFDESDLFSFEKYPYTKARIDRLMRGLAGGVQTTIVNGINAEWTLANNKNSELARRVFGDNIGRLTQAQYRRYFSTNDAAREAFLARKELGLNLSERVWNYANGFKSEMELGLDVGIRNGVPADEMSRELRQYLRHPDKLFRRVRDEHGDLVLSKRAQDFHPGQGVYRSSYMNARRLTATETNIAYRTADYERAQQLDFIVGIEVKLSNNHNCKGVPAGMFYDICDELQGRYPKDFKFTGFHPFCRCHAEAILKTEEELMAENRAILNGEEPSQESVNRVEDVPQNFKEWIADNADRIKRARSIPYFMRDNESWWKGGVNENKMALSKTEVLGGAVLAKAAMDEIRANVKNVSRKIGLFSDTTAINFKDTANGTIMEWDDERLTISTTRFKLSDGTVFCPADDIRMAFKKLNNGKTLTFNEEYSIECLFHESVHAGATKRIDALPGSIGDIIFETCTQLYARERYTKVLKLFNVEALNAEKIRIDGLGYQRECNLLRGIFTKDGVLQIGELKSIANGKADAVKTLELLCKKRGYNFDVIIKMLDN